MIKKLRKSNRLHEAESYGWVVEDYDAIEAYQFACDYMGKDYVDGQIVDTLSDEELASSLVYLFRMWDFREWDRYKNGEDEEDEFEESVNRVNRRKINERIGRNAVSFDNVGSNILHDFNGDDGYYDPEDGYQVFWKTCGDFTIQVISADDGGETDIHVIPKCNGTADLKALENEIGDLTFKSARDLEELERRLLAITDRGFCESALKKRSRARKLESKRVFGKKINEELNLDMWYGDEYDPRYYIATAAFYPNEGVYRGNIIRKADGTIVGDFECDDSVEIEKKLDVHWE